jgi:hypothetical protein
MAKRAIRIKDIAKAAGVSAGTVDRVLHNRGKVSEKALKRVNAALKKNEYRPNLIARTLSSSRSYKIAALVPNHEMDPYWEMAYRGIIQSKREWSHYGVHISTYGFDLNLKSSFEEVSAKVIRAKPDGILMAPIFYNETLPFFEVANRKKFRLHYSIQISRSQKHCHLLGRTCIKVVVLPPNYFALVRTKQARLEYFMSMKILKTQFTCCKRKKVFGTT